MLYLKSEYSCRYTGTARENRIGKPLLMDGKTMMSRKVERGKLDYKSTNGVLALKWKDNKAVTMLSNAAGIEPLSSISRYCKDQKKRIDVACPKVILEYNSHMGGIDKSDMLVHLYKIPTKACLLYTSPSPRDKRQSRMPSSA